MLKFESFSLCIEMCCTISNAGDQKTERRTPHFTLFFSAATAKALTTVLAGFALTLISLPKAKRLPALVAGLCLVLIMQTPGMVNLPFLTSLLARSAKASKTFDTSDLFFSHASPKASAMALLGMDFTLFIAFFMPFFMAFIAFLAILKVLAGLSIQPPPMTKIREDDRATKAKMAWTTTTTTITKVAIMMLIIITTIIPRIKDQTVTTEARRGERRLPCKIISSIFKCVCVM